MSDETAGVFLRLPVPTDQRVFRYKAGDDILNLLYRNPHRKFTITELRETTGHGGKSVDNAVKILDSLNLILETTAGRRSLIQIDHERVQKPDDPLLEIPQTEFREPAREFLERARNEQGHNLIGVLLFGSVARGEGDRASDIDIQVIVENNLLNARRELQDVRQEIESRSFEGNRYELQVLVESVDAAENYGEKLQDIFSEGITLHSSDRLEDLREVVFSGK